MRCVHWTPEYLDGLIVIAMLRAHDLDAHLFGENFVRQNWFQILVYDGFRVMVPSHQIETAHGLIVDFRNGAFELPVEELERPLCSQCDKAAGETDPGPRRWAFLAYLVAYLGYTASIVLLWTPWEYLFGLFVLFLMILVPCLPALVRCIVIGRYRCRNCANAWRELPDQHFFEQQLRAEAALNQQLP